jgi:hypothetical protein
MLYLQECTVSLPRKQQYETSAALKPQILSRMFSQMNLILRAES